MEITKQDMLEALKQVRDVDYLHTYGSICSNVQTALIFTDVGMQDIVDFLAPYFERWPKYSGERNYPVPHPDKSADVAYFLTKERFDQSTEYGRNRWELLHFIIAELEREIGQETDS